MIADPQTAPLADVVREGSTLATALLADVRTHQAKVHAAHEPNALHTSTSPVRLIGGGAGYTAESVARAQRLAALLKALAERTAAESAAERVAAPARLPGRHRTIPGGELRTVNVVRCGKRTMLADPPLPPPAPVALPQPPASPRPAAPPPQPAAAAPPTPAPGRGVVRSLRPLGCVGPRR